MSYDVYGVGNALVDIQTQVSEELLQQLKFAKGVMTLVEDEAQKQVLSRIRDLRFTRCAGGQLG